MGLLKQLSTVKLQHVKEKNIASSAQNLSKMIKEYIILIWQSHIQIFVHYYYTHNETVHVQAMDLLYFPAH